MNKDLIIDKSMDLLAFLLVAGFLFASGIGIYILIKCLYLVIFGLIYSTKVTIGVLLCKLGELIINL